MKKLLIIIGIALLGALGFWADYAYTEWKVNRINDDQEIVYSDPPSSEIIWIDEDIWIDPVLRPYDSPDTLIMTSYENAPVNYDHANVISPTIFVHPPGGQPKDKWFALQQSDPYGQFRFNTPEYEGEWMDWQTMRDRLMLEFNHVDCHKDDPNPPLHLKVGVGDSWADSWHPHDCN